MKQYTFKDGFKCVASTKEEAIQKHKVVANYKNKCSLSVSAQKELKAQGFKFKPSHDNEGESYDAYRTLKNGNEEWIACISPHEYVYKKYKNQYDLSIGRNSLVSKEFKDEKELLSFIVNKTKTSTKKEAIKISAFAADNGLEDYLHSIQTKLGQFRNIVEQTEIKLEEYDKENKASYRVVDVRMSEIEMSYHIQVINNKDKARDFIISIGSGFACSKIVFTVIDGNQSKYVQSIHQEIDNFVKEGLK